MNKSNEVNDSAITANDNWWGSNSKGDSWIHGVGTDPLKVAEYRALLRLRKTWRANAKADELDSIDRFERGLMMIPEHTWGLDEKTFLADYDHYAAASFQAARSGEKFRKFEASWAEQRAYIPAATNYREV